MTSTVGYIGSGIMATGMIKRLTENNTKVCCWNRSERNTLEAKSFGAEIFTNLSEMMKSVRESNNGTSSPNLFFMCVSDPNAVSDILSKYGLLENLTENDHLIDMSTVSVECVKSTSEQVKNFLEAPVSGSKPQAHGGTLVILSAGKKSTFEHSEKYFDMMGKKTFYFGDQIGAGARMKLCVNMFMGSVMASLGESLALAGKSEGITSEELVEVLMCGALAAPIVNGKGKAVNAGKFDVNFPLKHQQKDMRLALDLAEGNGLDLKMASAANALFENRLEDCGEEDFCAVAKNYKE